jgi:two-component system chemotaxis response regulator CheY
MSDPVKILLVDDFSTIRMVVKLELARLGYRLVDEAEDGMTALAMIEFAVESGDPYAVIICDWDMPAMNGLEVLQKIRSDVTLGNIPFLMLTGDSQIESAQIALNAGATDYLVKPISPDALAKKILKILDQRANSAA